MTVHGGDVWQVAEELAIPADELLDFSANINPRGLPAGALQQLARDTANPHLLKLYPDPSARVLRNALSTHLKIPSEAIVIGPGAEALMSPILHCLGAGRAARAVAPIPAFSEYQRVCNQHGVEFVPFPLDRSDCFRVSVSRLCGVIETAQFHVMFLNNPHNPSGALLKAAEVRRILNTAMAAGTTLLLDEAFIDYALHASLTAEAANNKGLIVLRSLTKFYGCPALRVGYAVAHPDIARQITSFLPTWGVTQAAMDALAIAVFDRDHAAATLHENEAEREALSQTLRALGLIVFPSAANFLLLELQATMPRASELRAGMMTRHGILIRNCDSYEGLTPGRYVRVAVRGRSDNLRLTQALAAELQPS